MSEATIQAGIQAGIQSLAAFANADVVINDWSILDQPVENAPYVIIGNSDTLISRRDAPSWEVNWQIPAYLFEQWTTWTETLNNLSTRRQAIVDWLNGNTNARSAGGLANVSINEIRNDGPISPYYDPNTPDELINEAMPIYVYQVLIFDVGEWST